MSMDDLEDLFEKGDGNGINFIPCVKWVKRGVAKSQPEKVKLTQEELAKIIGKTQIDLNELESGENDPENEDSETLNDGETMDVNVENDENEDNTAGLGIGNLMSHVNPRDDKYLTN